MYSMVKCHLTAISCVYKHGQYSVVDTIQGWLLFKGGYYLRVTTIQKWLLFKGGYYSRVATIQGWLLFKGGIYCHNHYRAHTNAENVMDIFLPNKVTYGRSII